MTDVSTVFLDLDDTICQHPRSTADRLADAFDRAGVEPFFGVADFRRWLPKVTAETELELRERCFGGIANECGIDTALAREVARAYEDPDPASVEFLPGAEAALADLAAEYDLGLVTNGGRGTQEAKLAALGVADLFDAAAYTEPGGPVKPDPDHFHRALSALDATPSEAVHVGNSLRADVAGAQAAGVQAVWLARTEATTDRAPDYTIDSMRDLRAPPWA